MPSRHLIAAAFTLLACSTAHAHGGGLNKDGCHNDRKAGGYHCHRGPNASPARAGDIPAPQFLTPPRPHPIPAAPSASGFQYRNCTEARAAGAAPVHRGDPGYGPHLDRDGDGVGCEPYRGR